jgi:hypothetical protein
MIGFIIGGVFFSILFFVFRKAIFWFLIITVVLTAIAMMFNSTLGGAQKNQPLDKVISTLHPTEHTDKSLSAILTVTNNSNYSVKTINVRCTGTTFGGENVSEIMLLPISFEVAPHEIKSTTLSGAILTSQSVCETTAFASWNRNKKDAGSYIDDMTAWMNAH